MGLMGVFFALSFARRIEMGETSQVRRKKKQKKNFIYAVKN
jgi:hypothetical protein